MGDIVNRSERDRRNAATPDVQPQPRKLPDRAVRERGEDLRAERAPGEWVEEWGK